MAGFRESRRANKAKDANKKDVVAKIPEEGSEEAEPRSETVMDAGEVDGTADIPEEYRDSLGNFKSMPVPRPMGSLTRRSPPLVVIVGVAGCGKSRLASALMGRSKKYRAVFRVGTKTVAPKLVVGDRVSVLDTPGLPDPYPQNSDTYYDDTVTKLRGVGYANAVLIVLNQERVTPTLIKNYGILYRAFNRLPCAKMFVLRRDSSFMAQSMADQAIHEAESRKAVDSILEATNLKRWNTQQFFMWTNGSGEEQDKQVEYIRDQVRDSPRVDISPKVGLQLTTEVAAAAAHKAEVLAKASAEATKGGRPRKKANKGKPKPKAEKAKADKPKADKPKAEKAKADKPKAEKAKADKPKADKPKADKPKADTFKADTQDEGGEKKNGRPDDRGKENEGSEEGKAGKSGCSIM